MWAYALAIVLAIAAATGIYFKGHAAGAESRNPEIVALQSAIERSQFAAAAAEEKANEAAAQVRIEYRTRTETIVKEAEARTELIEVIKREANPNCVLPPAYRELWDGPPSAGGGEAQSPARVDGAPVTVAEAAAVAAEAKERFERNEAKLIALQNYLSQIQEAPKPN